MFGKLGKQYAGLVGDKVEEFVGQRLSGSDKAKRTERATEQLATVHGKRKVLLIGINYFGQRGELRGCINDVKNIREFLEENYDIDEILVLTDDQSDPKLVPTRANILDGFRWLRNGAQSGDSLIMHYSGHGGSVEDTDGDEEDGKDETMIPVDYEKAGQIVDDEVHEVLVRGLPSGVRLTAVMDCCHSESILDLPYTYNINGDLEIIENDKNTGVSKLVASGVMFAMDGNKRKLVSSLKESVQMIAKGDKGGDSAARSKTVQTRTTDADVVMFSGCKDSQTSADAQIGGEATGAMSYALIKCLNKDKNVDYTKLLKAMRETLAGKYTQVPMLSAGRKLDLNSAFSL